jgi:hypothetical protein
MVDQNERAIESEQLCPLCGEKFQPKHLQKHLGRHMEQIALFVVPGSFEEEVDDNEDEGEDEGEDVDREDRAEDEDEGEDEDRKDRQEEKDEDAMRDPQLDDLPLVESAKFFEAAKSGDIET